MPKIPLWKSTYVAAVERVNYIFDHFERIYLSFSAGKDSTVMLHITMEVAKQRNRKIWLMIIDLEGQYKLTINHMNTCIAMYREWIDLYWICLPIHLRNAVSVYEPFRVCRDKSRKDDWIRELPEEAISDESYFPFFKKGMEFEEFVPLFWERYSQWQKTACLVWIRTDESLNRFRTIASSTKEKYEDKQRSTKVTEHVYNMYPIYDMTTEDIRVYQGKNKGKPYNKLYDYMYKAWLSIHQQRICQPYWDDQRRWLRLFHIIEPETRSKIVARVNWANWWALYINEHGNVNGYREISKPEWHTRKSFAKMLIASMPKQTQKHYLNKISLFEKWRKERWYEDGIPDEWPKDLESSKKIPSRRRVCKSLLRNDFWCKWLSFTQQKTDAYKRYLDLMDKKRAIGVLPQSLF